MNPRLLAALCVLGLLGAFAIDLATPQLFIAAILLDVPIVLSAFAASAIVGYFNGLWAGNHWDPIAIGNRFLAALSIILVGWLGLALHRHAEQRGMEPAIADAVRRERALREALRLAAAARVVVSCCNLGGTVDASTAAGAFVPVSYPARGSQAF
jgi:hypothetical protein